MVYKNSRVVIILRLLLITATILALVMVLETKYVLTPVFIGFLLLIQLFWLFSYIDRINRELSSFLEAIRFSEFNRTFRVEGMGSSFDELSKAFNAVIADFQKVRTEKEKHYQYFQSIVQNTDICIIAYTKDGHVELVNDATKKLFQTPSLTKLSDLGRVSKELEKELFQLTPGKTTLVKVHDEDDLLQLAISATEIKIQQKTITLATIKNIQTVLEDQETEAWQKLIRVLTHEIMNSITPISSLTATLELNLKDFSSPDQQKEYKVSEETINEFKKALQTINRRSTGLIHFVNTYRNLTRIPNPNFQVLPVSGLLKNVCSIMEDELTAKHIKFSTSIHSVKMEVSADGELIEQVLINLIKNSAHALEGIKNPEIQLKAFYNKRDRVTLQIVDNGKGILNDVIDKIFIPFFTTKPKGSGIGLSLSRQIMRLHGGSITATSIPGKATIFTLVF